jgi:hypothetical protein
VTGVQETLEETKGDSLMSVAEFTVFQVPVQTWSPFLLADLAAQTAKKLDKMVRNNNFAAVLHIQHPFVLTHKTVTYRVTVEATGYAPAFAGPAKWSLTLWNWS